MPMSIDFKAKNKRIERDTILVLGIQSPVGNLIKIWSKEFRENRDDVCASRPFNKRGVYTYIVPMDGGRDVVQQSTLCAFCSHPLSIT